MRVEIISAVLFVGLSVVAAYPYPQQCYIAYMINSTDLHKPKEITTISDLNVALPPHLLRQYLAQQQQGRQESAPIYEQESQTSVQPAYAQSQGQQIRNSGVQGLVQKAQAQPQQYVQQYVQQPQYAPQPQQPAYRPKPQLRPRPIPQQQAEEEQNPEDYDPSPNYQFGFDVNDDQFTNYQNRKEERQGDVIKGSYSVVDSDGFIRTVTYTADPKEGFKAEVVRKPTDIVVKVPTPAPATESPLRHQQAQYLEASSPVSRPQQQQYYRPQPQQHAQPQYYQQ